MKATTMLFASALSTRIASYRGKVYYEHRPLCLGALHADCIGKSAQIKMQ